MSILRKIVNVENGGQKQTDRHTGVSIELHPQLKMYRREEEKKGRIKMMRKINIQESTYFRRKQAGAEMY